MAYEKLIKRTIYQVKCSNCEWEETVDKNPPREKQCPNCRTWHKFEEVSYVGKDRFDE
jgi:hypothetical protein